MALKHIIEEMRRRCDTNNMAQARLGCGEICARADYTYRKLRGHMYRSLHGNIQDFAGVLFCKQQDAALMVAIAAGKLEGSVASPICLLCVCSARLYESFDTADMALLTRDHESGSACRGLSVKISARLDQYAGALFMTRIARVHQWLSLIHI